MSFRSFGSRFGKRAVGLLAVLSLVSVTLVAAPGQAQTGSDLREGSVFAMSNAREADGGNQVVAYLRSADGTLQEQGRYETGGTGSGSFEDAANGLVLGTSQGEAAPNNLVELADGGQQLLYVVNAGSDTISVFAVHADRLELIDVEPSGGEKPVSITVNGGIAYVLNSGETNDDLFDADGNVIDNCTTGHRPTVTGFTVSADGQLDPIQGSTRRLSGEAVSGCAQVSFTPEGDAIFVTERLSQPRRLQQQTSDNERLDDEGVIAAYAVRKNGKLSQPRVFDATGQGPFGFTFMKNGTLLTTEQSDGPTGIGRSTVASYVLDRSKNTRGLLRSSPAVQNGGTDTCWFVASDSQTIGFSTSFFADGRISSYELDELGIVQVLQEVATGPDAVNDNVALGASDISLDGDSDYLYQLNSVNGTISVFANNGDGTLTFVEQQNPFPQPDFGPGMGMAAPMGLAAN